MDMKKPLRDTKVFKILKSFSPLLSSIPVVGSIAANFLDNNSTKPGVMDKKELWPQLAQLAILAVLVYLVMSGKISWDDAEQAKDFLK